MRIMKTLLLTCIFLAVASCGPGVQTAKPAGVDLSNYDTFAFLPNTNAEVPGMDYNNEDVNRLVVETVNENMQDAGYALDRDDPDLLVLISTSTDIETETTTDPVYATYPYTAGAGAVGPYYGPYYYRGYGAFGGGVVGYDTDTYAYEEGTVVINLVDRETKETVWKGFTSDAIFDQPDTAAIQDLVNEIFDEYPLVEN